MSQQDQKKKVVLITGGSRGIGEAIVQKFKSQGWLVATCATSEERLEKSLADFRFKCDVSKAEEVKSGVEQVVKRFQGIDVLVNNAGFADDNSLKPNADNEIWNKVIGINLNGTYYMSKYALHHLPNNTGRIINLGSVLSLKGVGDAIAYCAAKHGVLGLTRALANRLAKRKITVNAVCPGWVRTDMAKTRMDEIGIDEEDLKTSVPLGRIVEPREVADLVYYLATSEGAAMITGQALTIDGGYLA